MSAQSYQIKRTSHIWSLILAINLVFLGTACREKNKVAQASKKKASSVVPSQPHKTGSIENYRLYIDGSESMQGFAGQESAFDKLLGSLDIFTGYQVFRYGYPQGSTDLTLERTTGQDMTKKGAYRLEYNPDDVLMREKILSDGAHTISVVVTDGVYSGPSQGSPMPVVEAIKDWLQKGYTLGILVFKSRFKGGFWSEKGHGWLCRDGKIQNKCKSYIHDVDERPFYAFVFSPTLTGFTDLRERLERSKEGSQGKFKNLESFTFSDEMIRITSVKVTGNVKGFYGSSSPPDTPYYWQMFDVALFKGSHSAVIPFHIQYLVLPDYPVKDLKPTVTESEYYLWKESQSIQQKEQEGHGAQKERFEVESRWPDYLKIDIGTSAQLADGNKGKNGALSTNVVVTMPQDTRSNYSYYHFRLGAHILGLRDSILGLSTPDDTKIDDTHKTYRFYELMDTLTQVHLDARLNTSLFLVVANR